MGGIITSTTGPLSIFRCVTHVPETTPGTEVSSQARWASRPHLALAGRLCLALKRGYLTRTEELRMGDVEQNRLGYRISTDRDAMDVDAIHAYLSRSYWAQGIPR